MFEMKCETPAHEISVQRYKKKRKSFATFKKVSIFALA